MENESFFMWFMSATPQEQYLANKVADLLIHFDDMLFKPHSIIDSYISITVNGQKLYDENQALSSFDGTEFSYSVRELDDTIIGCFDSVHKELTVHPKFLKDDQHILHEMIHMVEYVLNEQPRFYHDVVLLCLYQSLKNRIDDLDQRIIKHAHIVNGEKILNLGGNHDILFLLKSFDLDLRFGYKLGTVCGYGRDE